MPNAELAELADAHVSGACDRKVIRVQVPGSAQITRSPVFEEARCLSVTLESDWR